LYYSGDFDSTVTGIGAVFNETNTSEGIASTLATNFSVTKGKTWKVTGVFINSFTDTGTIQNPTPWFILKEQKDHTPGGAVCSGNDTATVKPTGRTEKNWGVPTEDTIQIRKLSKACVLKASKYFLVVFPTSRSLWYESGEQSDPHPIHHYGPKNILGNHYYGLPPNWQNVGSGVDDFSFGLTGIVE
jgi:hypothetical protein